MKIKASVELQVSVGPMGIRVGDSIITWGYLLDIPGVKDKLKVHLCGDQACYRQLHAPEEGSTTALLPRPPPSIGSSDQTVVLHELPPGP